MTFRVLFLSYVTNVPLFWLYLLYFKFCINLKLCFLSKSCRMLWGCCVTYKVRKSWGGLIHLSQPLSWEKPWFGTFAHFWDLNIFTMADFLPPLWWQLALWISADAVGSVSQHQRALASQCLVSGPALTLACGESLSTSPHLGFLIKWRGWGWA